MDPIVETAAGKARAGGTGQHRRAGDKAIQAARTAVYTRCMAAETWLIGKAIFAVYQREAAGRAG